MHEGRGLTCLEYKIALEAIDEIEADFNLALNQDRASLHFQLMNMGSYDTPDQPSTSIDTFLLLVFLLLASVSKE